MWSNIGKVLIQDTNNLRLTFIRHKSKGYKICWPEIPDFSKKSLKERLAELNYKDPAVYYKVDIGLPPPQITKDDVKSRRKFLADRRNDPVLEKASRTLTLNVPLEDIKVEYNKEKAPIHFRTIAEHYNIFDDLFGDAYFTPYVILNIDYPQEKSLLAPVYRGNIIKPKEAAVQPKVSFESDPNDLWTLMLTNPDGHFTEENKEYIHWLIGNIPGNDIEKGEVIYDYLPPFPPRGLGFQRFIFILYKQDRKIDYSKIKKKLPRLELSDRTFKTFDFYRERQDDMTPAGLSFFQSDWDLSVKDTFYNVLNMEEPVFEYDHDKPYVRPEEWYPRRKPFNMYLDKYRDPRDIGRDYLVEKLKKLDVLKPPEKPFPYPNALKPRPRIPSWLYYKRVRDNAMIGPINNYRIDEYQ